jgi:GntR family transcriptional regulator, transcriptional repressor for pyruvate dehydrogenase complex
MAAEVAMTVLSARRDAANDLFGSAEIMPIRLGQVVIERLSEAILDGRLKPGDPLPSEGQIAAACGISKQIAREAIRDLAAMGVIQIQQGKVARVRSLDAEPLGRFFRFAVRASKEGLGEAVEMRRLLEPPIARLAALRRTADGVARLDAILQRMQAALMDPPAWIDADLDFHETIAEMSGNRLLRLQMRGLRPILQDVMQLFNARRKRSKAEWRETLERHARVVAAIKSGDGDAAFRAMEHHFEAAQDAIRELFPLQQTSGGSGLNNQKKSKTREKRP